MPIFYNLKSIRIEKDENSIIYEFNDLESKLFKNTDSEMIYFILVFIYINQLYPSYDPSLLFYIYIIYYKENSKKFFWNFINCIKDKENQKNIQVHLFLEKDEKNFGIKNKNIKMKIIKYHRDIVKKIHNISMENFLLKHLISSNYSKNSFFYEYINYKIDEIITKIRLNEIESIIIYYALDKNEEIRRKILDKFVIYFFEFYQFLYYDNEIVNNEQNMLKTIELLQYVAKNSKEKIQDQNGRVLKEIANNLSLRFYVKEQLQKGKKIMNLYTFFKILKQEKKKLIDVINGNIILQINILLVKFCLFNFNP